MPIIAVRTIERYIENKADHRQELIIQFMIILSDLMQICSDTT